MTERGECDPDLRPASTSEFHGPCWSPLTQSPASPAWNQFLNLAQHGTPSGSPTRA